MMSVLLVCEVAVFGGVNTVVRELWKHLPREQLPTRLLVPTKNDNASARFIKEWFQEDQNRVLVQELRGRGRYLTRLANALRFFRSQPETCVNFHCNTIDGVSPPFLWAARLARKRVVLTVQHLDAEPVRSYARRHWLNFGFDAAHEIICSTPMMEKRLEKLAPKEKIHVVPNGIRSLTKTYDRLAMRKKFGIPNDALVVGHISRLISGKGLPRVIEAVKKLTVEIPNIYLMAAGSDGIDANYLKELINKELPGRSQLIGYIEDHHEMLSSCDIFAVPSGWEGFGLVYIEAGLHGLPRIGTRMGGVPYVVCDGMDGFLLEFDDIDGLVERICELAKDTTLRKTMGLCAKIRANDEFSAELMSKRYAEIIRSVR